MRTRMAIAALAAALTAAVGSAVAPSSSEAGGSGSPCTGDLTAAGVPKLPGPRLRMGITPAGRAGAIGPPVPLTPIDRGKTLAALHRLRPPGAPFVLRLNRFFWSDGKAGIRRFQRLTRLYTSRGYQVELQLRYHPRPAQEGDIDAWVGFVRRVVRKFGPNPRVTALQVTNEVNFYRFAPDASDSAYDRARRALVRGVEAAHHLVNRLGFDHMKVGFNWAYRTDPNREARFWGFLRERGGKRFARSVDWVGLDAYPGTVFPPTEPPIGNGYRDGMVNAMSQLRECFMPIARLGRDVPIHVEENGWPTGPERPESEQVRALRQMVGAVNDFRGTYHVTDYRWFDLRDHNSAGPSFQQHYGLLRDDYSPKPAFDVYRRLVRRLAG
ncbi:MAG: hypothetical protein ACJ75I_04080 [Solirubrobacterales bacterium]